MKKITNEQLIYAIILCLALLLRLINLGATPLSNSEAVWALDAYQVAKGSADELNANPFYILWTSVLFFIFGDSNFTARVLNALFGTLLVCLPIFLKPWIGKKAALIFAFGLAFDPSLLAASRMAGGPMIAICLSYGALIAWLYNNKFLSLLFIAIAILSGHHALHGVLGLLLVGGVIWIISRLGWIDVSDLALGKIQQSEEKATKLSAFEWFTILGILIAAATFFLRYPQGIAAVGRTFFSYLESWGQNTTFSLLGLFGLFFVSEIAVVLIGGLGFIRAWVQRNDFLRIIGIGSLVLFLWIVVYPQREPLQLGWIALPLWLLTAHEIMIWIENYLIEEKLAALGHMGLILILMSLIWINLAGLALPQPNEEVLRTRWILLMGVVSLIVLSTLLVGLGWSVSAAKFGLLTGVAVGLILYMVGTARAVVFPRAVGEGAYFSVLGNYEQWSTEASSQQVDYMLKTLGDLAEWKNGHRRFLDIAVINPRFTCLTCPMPPAINWALRGFSDVTYLPQLEKELRNSVILTSIKQPAPMLTSAYRGQSFTLFVYPAWEQMSISAWINYIIQRQLPSNQEQYVLWVKDQLLTKSLNE